MYYNTMQMYYSYAKNCFNPRAQTKNPTLSDTYLDMLVSSDSPTRVLPADCCPDIHPSRLVSSDSPPCVSRQVGFF